MYLKRLELAGFKTFAERTELEFPPGICAIVGPNGSGKSNLFDAIRWVLGEQSARALRGARMEDVIFAGSEGRRAVGLAQVTLTVDNTSGFLPLDFTEVSVSRRATRGGEGEFYLNGLPCRLRDIQMLFLGTGLGGRSYSLIGQGEVDAILNASPQERRLWLEEAAGLGRTKRRRHEALRRLEHTAHHMERLHDLLGELRTQHTSLAAQAEVARQHRTYADEIRSLEIALVADEARRTRQALRRAATQAEGTQARLAALQAQAGEASRRVEALQGERDALMREWERLQRDLVDLAQAQTEAETSLERSLSRLDAHRRDEARIRTEAARLTEDLERACRDVVAVQRERSSAERDLAAVHQALQEQAAVHRAADARRISLTDRLRHHEAERVRIAQARDQAAREVAVLEARTAALQRQHATLETRRRRLEDQIAGAEAEDARLAARHREAQEALEAVRREQETSAHALRAVEQERDATADEHRAADAARHRLSSRLQALEEAHAQLLGYEEGVRALLLAKRADPHRFAGIVGPLIDHIDVEPEFRGAVQAALGRRAFCLMTTDVGAVQEGLAYLRGDGAGAASFLPLDHLTTRRLTARPGANGLPNLPGVLGPATRFVTATDGAARALAVLLNDVIIVETLEAALRCRVAGYPGRIVTRAGEVLSPDGVITVRSRGNGGSAIERHAELPEARRALREAEQHAAMVAARLDDLERRVQASRSARAILDQERALRERDAAQVEGLLQAAHRDRARLPVELEEVSGEVAFAESGLAEAARLRTSLDAGIGGCEREARSVEAAIAEAQAAIDGEAAALTARQGQTEALRVRIAEIEARRGGLVQREEDFAHTRDGLMRRRSRLLGEVAVLAAQTADLEQHVAAAQHARAELADQRESLQRRIMKVQGARAAREGDQAAAQEALVRVQAEVRDSEAAVHRLEVRSAQLDAEWAAVERRLREEFGATWEQAEEAKLPGTRDETLGRLQALRGLMGALGPVNLRAIEEQEALGRRIETLATQVDDLERTREALNRLIGHLDRVLRVRFQETFDAVDTEFGRLFVRLFDGGEAGLALVEDENPEVEPGLDVIVRVPGKKPRMLAALSGGERVLVALSLLFAMLRVHPSPFCVFDEVEAALDDPNTRRFTRLLQDLAQQTQIVIITHNKGTMESADVLYGITMQEPGISSVLSVRLTPASGNGSSAGDGFADDHSAATTPGANGDSRRAVASLPGGNT